jgi:voltage-gated potassium channel
MLASANDDIILNDKQVHSAKRVDSLRNARNIVSSSWRYNLFVIMYRNKLMKSKIFGVSLFLLILISTVSTMLETIDTFDHVYHQILRVISIALGILFTLEYVVRLFVVPRPWSYVFGFMGITDALAIIPTYLVLFGYFEVNYLICLRLVRVFRLIQVFDLSEHSREAEVLLTAVKSSRRKITIFLMAVFVSVTVAGSFMYVIEGPENGFNNIPKGVYWAIVTLATVGYGDVAPKTPLGQFLASILMLMGYSSIVVPTTLVSAEIAKYREKKVLENKTCLDCGLKGHDSDAYYCKQCGSRLWDNKS